MNSNFKTYIHLAAFGLALTGCFGLEDMLAEMKGMRSDMKTMDEMHEELKGLRKDAGFGGTKEDASHVVGGGAPDPITAASMTKMLLNTAPKAALMHYLSTYLPLEVVSIDAPYSMGNVSIVAMCKLASREFPQNATAFKELKDGSVLVQIDQKEWNVWKQCGQNAMPAGTLEIAELSDGAVMIKAADGHWDLWRQGGRDHARAVLEIGQAAGITPMSESTFRDYLWVTAEALDNLYNARANPNMSDDTFGDYNVAAERLIYILPTLWGASALYPAELGIPAETTVKTSAAFLPEVGMPAKPMQLLNPEALVGAAEKTLSLPFDLDLPRMVAMLREIADAYLVSPEAKEYLVLALEDKVHWKAAYDELED